MVVLAQPGCASFDPYDQKSWDYGEMEREAAERLLADSVGEDGVFIVRTSVKEKHQRFPVLSVTEQGRVAHYKIDMRPASNNADERRYVLGESRIFLDLPSLLNYYKMHRLDRTTLMRPLPRARKVYVAKHDFEGQAKSDLSIRRGDILTYISEGQEKDWWRMSNEYNQEGTVPANFLEEYNEREVIESLKRNSSEEPDTCPPVETVRHTGAGDEDVVNKALPARARVLRSRVPNVYDRSALSLHAGDIITVTKTSADGTWEGQTADGKSGHFQFTFVEFVE